MEPEGRGAAGGVESRGEGWSTTDQGGAGGTREPGGACGLMGHGGEEGARNHGGAAGSTGRGGVRDSEAGGIASYGDDEGWQTEQSSHCTDGGLRASRGAARRQRWRRQEQAGVWVGISDPPGSQGCKQEQKPFLANLGNGSPLWANLRNRSPLWAELGNNHFLGRMGKQKPSLG